MQEASDALSKLQTATLFRPIRSLQCSWSNTVGPSIRSHKCGGLSYALLQPLASY